MEPNRSDNEGTNIVFHYVYNPPFVLDPDCDDNGEGGDSSQYSKNNSDNKPWKATKLSE